MLHSSQRTPALWGYAGVFPGEFEIWRGDKLSNQLRFVATHGFDVAALGLKTFDDPATVEKVAELVAETGLKISCHFGLPYFTASLDELKEKSAQVVERISELQDLIPFALVTTCAGAVHRFQQYPALGFQLERLHQALDLIATGCHSLGLGVGIENHGDYYLSDLIDLCRSTPPLGIFLDTGNCFLVGERPVEACRAAAPYVVGTHFKDHFVEPDPKTLTFKVYGATLGDGDAGLEQIYSDLMANHPNPESIVFEIEFVPDRNMNALESWERSKAFLGRLRGKPFPASQRAVA